MAGTWSKKEPEGFPSYNELKNTEFLFLYNGNEYIPIDDNNGYYQQVETYDLVSLSYTIKANILYLKLYEYAVENSYSINCYSPQENENYIKSLSDNYHFIYNDKSEVYTSGATQGNVQFITIVAGNKGEAHNGIRKVIIKNNDNQLNEEHYILGAEDPANKHLAYFVYENENGDTNYTVSITGYVNQNDIDNISENDNYNVCIEDFPLIPPKPSLDNPNITDQYGIIPTVWPDDNTITDFNFQGLYNRLKAIGWIDSENEYLNPNQYDKVSWTNYGNLLGIIKAKIEDGTIAQSDATNSILNSNMGNKQYSIIPHLHNYYEVIEPFLSSSDQPIPINDYYTFGIDKNGKLDTSGNNYIEFNDDIRFYYYGNISYSLINDVSTYTISIKPYSKTINDDPNKPNYQSYEGYNNYYFSPEFLMNDEKYREQGQSKKKTDNFYWGGEPNTKETFQLSNLFANPESAATITNSYNGYFIEPNNRPQIGIFINDNGVIEERYDKGEIITTLNIR